MFLYPHPERPSFHSMKIIALAPLLLLAACATPDWRDASVPVTPIAGFQLDRYTGDWFEIARFPNWFEDGCSDVRTNYTPRTDGRIDVTNICPTNASGDPTTATGVARTTDTPGALEVRFAPSWVPFAWADYIVVWTDPDYRAAVVASPVAVPHGFWRVRRPPIWPYWIRPAQCWAQTAMIRMQ